MAVVAPLLHSACRIVNTHHLVLQLCREHIGRHPCDKRSRTSHYQQQFPAVDFSLVSTPAWLLWLQVQHCAEAAVQHALTAGDLLHISSACLLHLFLQPTPSMLCLQVETEEDVLWTPDVREAPEDIKHRGMQFILWLMQRPEQHIAVVGTMELMTLDCAGQGCSRTSVGCGS